MINQKDESTNYYHFKGTFQSTYFLYNSSKKKYRTYVPVKFRLPGTGTGIYMFFILARIRI